VRSLSVFLFFLVGVGSLFAGDVVNHNIKAEVVPVKHLVVVTDEVTLPDSYVKDSVSFLLHSGMDLICLTDGVKLTKLDTVKDYKQFGMKSAPENLKVEEYVVKLNGKQKFKVEYSGEIYHPIQQLGEQYARGFSETPGTIEEQGIYLSRSSFWLPYFKGELVTFDLTTKVPKGWDSVSQGTRTVHELSKQSQITKWEAKNPTDDIFFCGAEFTEYKTQVGKVNIMAFLRTPDENLANKYLETTGQYLVMYENLIGKYPYSKFALVENFWQTGYGMPSFTLLGPQIIRFPFILHSSYPHELLHNWWGNSVYVDYESGNWCEGITVYLADHLIKEQRGQGKAYRRATLQKFTDYVTEKNDFPLTKFLNRNNASSESVGYGKSMMMFNMLRTNLGDKKFIEGIQLFNKNNKFKKASFSDICIAFEKVTKNDLKPFFKQWTERLGAPKLKLKKVEGEKLSNGFLMTVDLEQVQKEDAFGLNIPVAVTFKDEKMAKIQFLKMDKKSQSFKVFVEKQPVHLSVDPQFNLMRRLDVMEVPPSLSKVLGASKITIILPANDKKLQTVYQKLAGMWAKDKTKNIEVVFDKDLKKLPDNPCWIFGWDNKFANIVSKEVKKYGVSVEKENIKFGKQALTDKNNSVVVSVRNPDKADSVVVFLGVDNEKAVMGLSRKLLHYGKYSYLVFEGEEPANIVKGTFNAINSPLSKDIVWAGKSVSAKQGVLTPRNALAKLAPVFSKKAMKSHVEYLASEQLEGRGFGSKGLEKAAAYIANKFKEYGLKPEYEKGFVQDFSVVGGENNRKTPLKNIVGVIQGSNPKYNGEAVVLGAHYDHLGYGWPDVSKGNKGKIHFGADDNASGVSVLLELARVLGKSFKPERTLVFVAFSGEEFGLKGSKYFVENAMQYPLNKTMGMVNLDTVGRLGKGKLMIIGGNSSPLWKHVFMGTSYVTGVDTVLITEDLDSSDQKSFIAKGIPAIQLFSGPNLDYHKPTDTADKIDYTGMVKVATVAREVVACLCEREEQMPFVGKKTGKPVHPAKQTKKGGKRASTGIIPDFAFSGEGVGVSGTAPNSPAKKAGIKKGDAIVAVNGKVVKSLRDYSNVLKQFKPGDKLKLKVLRDGKTFETEFVLAER